MFVKLYLVTILISTLIGLYHYNQLPKYLKAFSIFLLLTLAIECLGYFLIKKNTWMFNIFTGVEFIFYLSVYRYILTSISQKKVILLFITSFILASLGNMIFFQGLFKFNNYSYSYGSMLVCICAIMYFLQLLHHTNPQPLTRIPMFWISTGLLIFYACNFFYMGLLNYLIGVSMDLARELFMIISLLNIMMYSLFSAGIICYSATRQR
jgi:hypothetical protein